MRDVAVGFLWLRAAVDRCRYHHRRGVGRLAVCSGLALSSGLALAQVGAPAASSGGIEEVVVTAERRPETLQTVPISMSAITGEALEKLGDKNFFDYATTIPNLAVGMGTGAGGQGNGFGVSSSREIIIRGVAGNNTTGLYLNDTPIPVSMDPRVLDVERIEVLRGPQGTLFGASAMGGTVRIITRDPGLDRTSGKVEAEGFDVDHGGGGYSADGTLNVPLIAGSVGLRVSAYSAFDPGYFTREWGGVQDPRSPSVPYQPGVPVQVGSKSVGADQQTGLMLSLGIAPSGLPGLTVTPLVIYQRSNSNGYPLADYTPDNLIQIRPLNVPEAVRDTWDFEALTLTYDTGFGRIIASGTHLKRNGFDLEDGTDFGSAIFPGTPYYVAQPLYNNLYIKQSTGEARFESSLHGPVQFVLGVFSSLQERFYHENFDAPGLCAALNDSPGCNNLFTQNSPNADRQRAAFLDVTYNVTNALAFSAGVRRAYLDHEGTLVQSGYNGPPAGGTFSTNSYSNHSENDTAPRFTAKYQLAPDQLLYASAAKGFRIGGVNPIYGPNCLAALARAGLTNGQGFNSDSLWSYEIGTKNSWFDNRVKSRLSVYKIDWKGIQQTTNLSVYDPTGACTFNETTNSGAAVSKGAELEIDAAPIERLTLNLAVGYEDAKITQVTPGSLTVLGQPINEVPKWNGSATVQYSVPLGERSLFIRSQYRYSASRISFLNVAPLAGGRPLNSYSLVDLRAGVSQGPWEVALFARNLFNASAEIGDLNPEVGELTGRPRWLIATPRTVGLQLRRAF